MQFLSYLNRIFLGVLNFINRRYDRIYLYIYNLKQKYTDEPLFSRINKNRVLLFILKIDQMAP